jgi:hypothetical protein
MQTNYMHVIDHRKVHEQTPIMNEVNNETKPQLRGAKL